MYPGVFYGPNINSFGMNFNPQLTGITSRNIGLFNKISNGFKNLNIYKFMNGANKTLNFINQTIPLIKEARPLVNNMKSLIRLARLFNVESTKNNSIDEINHSKKVNDTQSIEKFNNYVDYNYPKFFI